MAFAREEAAVAVSIPRIEIVMVDSDEVWAPGDTIGKSIHYRVAIKRSDGTMVVRQGDMAPELTQAEITWLLAFVEKYRTRAENVFLPE